MFPVNAGWKSLLCVFFLPTLYYVLVQSIPLPQPNAELSLEHGPYFIFLFLAMAPAGIQPYTIMESVTGIRVTAIWPNMLWTFICALPAVFFIGFGIHVPVMMIAIAGATWNTLLVAVVYILAQRQVPERNLKPYLFPYVALLTLQDSYFFMCFGFMIFFSVLSSSPGFQVLGLIIFQSATHFVFKGAGLTFILRRLAPLVPNIDHIRSTVILFYEFLAELFLSFSFPKVSSVWVLVFASVTEVTLFSFAMARFFHPDPKENSFFVRPRGEHEINRKGMMNSHDAWVMKLKSEKKARAIELESMDKGSSKKHSSKPSNAAKPYMLPGSTNVSSASMTSSSEDDGGHRRGRHDDDFSSSSGSSDDDMVSSSYNTMPSTNSLTSDPETGDKYANPSDVVAEGDAEDDLDFEKIDPSRDVRVTAPSFFCLLVFELYAVFGFIAFYSNYCWGVNSEFYAVASACSFDKIWIPFMFSMITAALHVVAFFIIRHRVRKIHKVDALATGIKFLWDNEVNSIATMCCCYVISTYFFLAHIDTFDFLSQWVVGEN